MLKAYPSVICASLILADTHGYHTQLSMVASYIDMISVIFIKGKSLKLHAPVSIHTMSTSADDNKNDMFAFTCSSDYADVANGLDIPKSRLGTCMDSGASQNYCPDHMKFTNYKEVC